MSGSVTQAEGTDEKEKLGSLLSLAALVDVPERTALATLFAPAPCSCRKRPLKSLLAHWYTKPILDTTIKPSNENKQR